MLFNYFKVTLRHLLKHKSFSVINIAGLSVGMTCSLLILIWIQDELNYDRFHRDANRIYRANIHLLENDIKAAVGCAPIAEAAQREVPLIEQTIRLSTFYQDLMQVEDKIFEEKRILYADSNFFEFFTFPLIHGDAKTALQQPESIVLTEQMAVKYFGTTDVVGRTIRKTNKNEEFTISGVMASMPSASHLQFDFIEPMSFLARTQNDLINHVWDNFGWWIYVKTQQSLTQAEIKEMDKAISDIYKKNEPGLKLKYFLEPITQIHLTPGVLIDVPGVSDRQYIYIFGVVGLFILAVACMNFMNLATARSARRAKEVGLRKVAGAFRGQLILQFLSESTVIAIAALILSLALSVALLPSLNEITGKTLSLDLTSWKLVLSLVGITILSGGLAGSYPALLLSGFMPAKVLKGELAQGPAGKYFRNTMVVTQFSISILLLVGTTVIFQQLRFIQQRNIGYDKENLVYLPINGDLGKDIERLRTLLGQDPATSHFTITSDLPTNLVNGTFNVEWDGKDPDAQPLFPNAAVDENFIDVFKMTLLSGRSFSRDIAADSTNYIVNEQSLKLMDMTPEDAIGKRLTFQKRKGTIVGVVKDFNFKPVQTAVEPIILQLNPGYGLVVVRSNREGIEKTIAGLKSIHEQLNPQYPFTYEFVDKDLERMYQSEQTVGKLFSIFAGLGLFISCLGLYGLSAFLAERRTKEIGIRKVLGATIFRITWLLSVDFTKPIVVAALIAIPLSWYIMSRWLESFVYHINIGWQAFALALTASLVVALLTVSFETVKAAMVNPSKSLKT